MDVFKGLQRKYREYKYAKLLSGLNPIFSQFGNSIYASDVVQNCIDIIATEISKLQPRHIRSDPETNVETYPKSSFNRLFKFAPNPVMTTKDFLEKIMWLLYLNYNAFIYPTYDIATDTKSGKQTKIFTGFYPLDPREVIFLEDKTGTLFIRMKFKNGFESTIPYQDVIHLRKKFSLNEIMGGGTNGLPDNTSLLKTLEIDDIVIQGIGKAIKTSLSIRGVMKINTLLDDEKQKEERKQLEAKLAEGDTGILPIDLQGEYTPINVDPKIIDKTTMEFLQSKVLNWFGVSVPILTGDFNDEQYQAFYEKTLEPIMISLGQAFSKCLFTTRELDFGNEIVFYQKNMMYLSTNAKINLIKTAGEQGLLSDNQKLALLGYPPIENGTRITQSLNYIDRSIINVYQLNQMKEEKTNGKE